MKRNFYLCIKAVEPLTNVTSTEFVYSVFPASDVKEHLISKLTSIKSTYHNPFVAMLSFYERLDTDHQRMFDVYMNVQMEKLDKTTIQYF